MEFSFRKKGDLPRNEFYAQMNSLGDNEEYFVGFGNLKMKPHYPKLLLGKQIGSSFHFLQFSKKSSFMLPRIFVFEDFPFQDFGFFQKTGGLSNYVLVDYEHTHEVQKFVQSSSKNSSLELLVDTTSQITSQDIDYYLTQASQEYISNQLKQEGEFKLRRYHNTPRYLALQ